MTNVQPFAAHVRELRKRVSFVAIVFAIGGAIGYGFRSQLIVFLQKPLNQTLYYGSPSGGFELVMDVAFLTGFLIAFPILLYQLIRFTEPAFNKKIGKQVWHYTIAGTILAIIGVIFAYLMILPSSLHFFAEFSNSSVHSLIQAQDYLRFVTSELATFAVLFQLPLVLSIIDKNITPLPPKKLNKYQRHVIIGSLALAVILPFTYDPITQFALAIPMIGLYELSVVMIWMRHVRQGRIERRLSKDEKAEENARIRSFEAMATAEVQPVYRRAPQPQTLRPMATPVRQQVPRPIVAPLPPQPALSGMIDLKTLEEQRIARRRAPQNVLDLRPQS